MIKKILDYIKNNYDWLFDLLLVIVLAAAIIHMVTCHSGDAAKTTEKHIEAVTASQSQTKEVQANAQTVHQTQAENDRRIQARVKSAVAGVPDELTALVDMANAIIRNSNASRR